MSSDEAKFRFASALTQASLGKIPPELHVATGYDDEVMLFLRRVADPRTTTEVLMDVITLSEFDSILAAFNATGGLIRKRFHIDEAHRLKVQLETTGAVVEFIRPDTVENAGQ